MTAAQEFGVVYFPYWEFDERGNVVYYESSNGFWAKYQYDVHGNKVYYENSKGYILRKGS
jgi:hypothetical protein